MIKPLTRFWLALEQLPSLAGVIPHWRHLLREDYDQISPLLTPERERAAVFPRLGDFRDRCREPYRVVEHGPDDIVGLGEEGEPPIALKRTDLIVSRLDATHLIRVVAPAMGITAEFGSVAELPLTFRVGLYRPLAGFEFPVFLTIQLQERDYRLVLESLLARTPGPFLLLAPTNRHHRIASKLLMDTRNASFLALADTLQLTEDRQWVLSESGVRQLSEFCAKVLPPSEHQAVLFPTPAAARWADLTIRFVDGDTVSIKIGTVNRMLTYAQMGMVDGRSAKPTVQWELLRDFARHGGRLTWHSSAAQKKNQKRVEILAKNLHAFFRLAGDPIRYLPDEKGWQTVFTVLPD